MRLKIIFASLLSLALALSLSSCEGDRGPIGPTGPQGPTGSEGPIGQTGEGVQNCQDCHSSNQLIAAKMFQWENSVHALGGHYERNQASCAICHTSQGFLEVVGTGATSAGADVKDPLPQNCYTCHQIHQTYTQEDWALTNTDPVTFWVKGETADIGKGNLCLNCHQARIPSPEVPEPGTGGMYTVTSSRYGPHHGSQGMMFTGNAGYEVAGSVNYTDGFHTPIVENGCVTCHMAETTGGRDAGGHTFRVASEDGELNTNGCIQCHMDEDELLALVDDTQAELEDLLLQLGTKLFEMGILRDNLESVNASSSAPLELTDDEVGALWNYQYVREDKSLGVHNGKYARALLINSLESLN